MNVLVVGANGQLGAACCRALVAEGHRVRASVRSPDRVGDPGLDGVELVVADLAADPDLDALLAGVEVVVLTANVAVPRDGDDLERFDAGVHRLVEAAGPLGVRRIVLPSLPVTEVDAAVPLADERRRLEAGVRSAVPGSVILRFRRSWSAGWRWSGPPCPCAASHTRPSGARPRSCAGSAGPRGRPSSDRG